MVHVYAYEVGIMSTAINGCFYLITRYLSLLGSFAFASTTVLCYILGALLTGKVVASLFRSLIQNVGRSTSTKK